MKIQHDYIKAILNSDIIINCVSWEKKIILKKIGCKCKNIFDRSIWKLEYEANNKIDLASKLEKLRDIGFSFAGGPGGWPPAAVFLSLRNQGVAHGRIVEITWMGLGKFFKREL